MRKAIIICLLFALTTVSYAPISSFRSFNAGIWAPKLASRHDVRRYYSACRELENMIVMPQGPVYKRSGSYYIAAASGSTVRMIPFESSAHRPFVIELGDETMRFYK